MRVPILRLNARVLIVAMSADIPDEDLLGFQGELCERTAELQVRGVVVDVSALDLIDSFMARVLNETARMLNLLGAEVVVCGLQPAVAMTLVEMGRRLVDTATAFTLEGALVLLERMMVAADSAAGGSTPGPARHV